MHINRRSIVATGIAAVCAAAGPGRAIAAPDAPSGLEQLIDVHRAALAAWVATLTSQDNLHEDYDPSPAAKARYDTTSDVEWEAREALLSYRCRTFVEITARADYIAERESDVKGGMSLDPAQMEMLLASMRSLAA